MNTHLSVGVGILVLFSGCLPEDDTPALKSWGGSGPAEGAAKLKTVRLDVRDSDDTALEFTSDEGCPVVPSSFSATLAGTTLKPKALGSGQWVYEQRCSGSLFSFCSREKEYLLRCIPPQFESEETVSRDVLLVLSGSDASGPFSIHFPVALKSFKWEFTKREGELVLTSAGDVEAIGLDTEVVVHRPITPAGTFRNAVRRLSSTELVLPDAANWAGSTIELTTYFRVLGEQNTTLEATIHQSIIVE